ncbi:Hypothetical_protein [Hexamita inflata]|uniref:Hypothetical_protein n=1 Tax=Hexamita inflata TaxID=28002 RepID=A0AA86PA24_9EUKA|nr:Hypothetical protein HINF_LOCUS22566 [Hexamita inflata]
MKAGKFKVIKTTQMVSSEIRSKLLLDPNLTRLNDLNSNYNPTTAGIQRTVQAIDCYFPRKKITSYNLEPIQSRKSTMRVERSIIDIDQQYAVEKNQLLQPLPQLGVSKKKIKIENGIETKKKKIVTRDERDLISRNIFLNQDIYTPLMQKSMDIAMETELFTQTILVDEEYYTLNNDYKKDFSTKYQIERPPKSTQIQYMVYYKITASQRRYLQFPMLQESFRNNCLEFKKEIPEKSFTVQFENIYQLTLTHPTWKTPKLNGISKNPSQFAVFQTMKAGTFQKVFQIKPPQIETSDEQRSKKTVMLQDEKRNQCMIIEMYKFKRTKQREKAVKMQMLMNTRIKTEQNNAQTQEKSTETKIQVELLPLIKNLGAEEVRQCIGVQENISDIVYIEIKPNISVTCETKQTSQKMLTQQVTDKQFTEFQKYQITYTQNIVEKVPDRVFPSFDLVTPNTDEDDDDDDLSQKLGPDGQPLDKKCTLIYDKDGKIIGIKYKNQTVEQKIGANGQPVDGSSELIYDKDGKIIGIKYKNQTVEQKIGANG